MPVIVTSKSHKYYRSFTSRSRAASVRAAATGWTAPAGWTAAAGRTAANHPALGAGTPIGLVLQVCSTLSVFHTRGPGPGTARASVNARTHLPVTTAASSRRASVSQVWPVGRRTEPEAL